MQCFNSLILMILGFCGFPVNLLFIKPRHIPVKCIMYYKTIVKGLRCSYRSVLKCQTILAEKFEGTFCKTSDY